MKLKSKELKRMARETLNGQYNLPIGALVITQLLIMSFTMPFQMTLGMYPTISQLIINYLATFIIALLSTVLSCGLVKIHLDISRGKETKLSDLFYFFKQRPDRVLLSSLLLVGLTVIAMIPVLIALASAILGNGKLNIYMIILLSLISLAGVMFLSLTYNFIFHLLVDYPKMGVLAAFTESKRMMKGNRCRLLYIMLSFIGMSLLGLLSFGIGFLWVTPYMSQTSAKFYQNLKGEIS